METQRIQLPYRQTGYFSSIVSDYLSGAAPLRPFYQHTPDLEGIRQAIAARQQFATNRAVLAGILDAQYAGIETSPATEQNRALLGQENTFAITTAHQPNIFTGPLYVVYKILHTIRLAAWLKEQLPQHHFVPVFYMGSEDADLEELGNITIGGKKYTWQTSQTGAVGRMQVDKALLQLVADMEAQLGGEPYGNELAGLFRAAYTPGATIQQATLQLLNRLFGRYGLVILIPDQPAVKQLLVPLMERELLEQFSHQAVAGTVAALQEKQYKVQASGRDINLFYLDGAARERIVATATGFAIHNTDLQFTREAMLEELRLHPERFSPNVILRGILQETVLPNIVFVGGGGELAYWLELKQVFAAAQVPYPVLILRNSFLLVEENIQALLQKTGLTVTNYFQPLPALERMLTEAAAEAPLRLEQELQALQELYGQIGARAGRIALPLQAHVAALQAQAQKKLLALEKKMLRAEKKKHEALIRQAHKIKEALFPRNSLQERVENMAAFYTRYGPALFDTLLACSPAVEQQFTIAGLPAKTHSVI